MDLSVSASSPQPAHLAMTTTGNYSDEDTTSDTRVERISYQTSPHAPNTPENNICKLVEYRGAKVASFTVGGRELICLPQAFELFLKHLVGGLHTVYTKLKRLEITPVVCNVEQVRILRGLQSIQPGVNRCKLLSPDEFDVLYDDCTSSSARPGRPPKRSSFICLDSSEAPHKLMKKSNPSGLYYPNEDGKPAGGLPPYPSYPQVMPTLPFVAPYQLNFMQQAAMQMAFANQMNNLNRAKENIAFPRSEPPATSPVVFNHRIEEREKSPITQLTKQHSANGSPRFKSPEAKHISVSSPDSVHHAVSPEYRSRLHSPHDEISHRPIEPVHRPNGITHNTSDNTRRVEPLSVNIPAVSTASSDNRRRSSSQSPASAGSVSTNHSNQMVDDILTHIRTDIKSFMSTVLEHQEQLLGELDMLRSSMKQWTVDQQCLNHVVQEHQRAKSMYKLYYEREQQHKKQIHDIIDMSKTDLTSNLANQQSLWMMKGGI